MVFLLYNYQQMSLSSHHRSHTGLGEIFRNHAWYVDVCAHFLSCPAIENVFVNHLSHKLRSACMKADYFPLNLSSPFFDPHYHPVGGNFSFSLLIRPGNFSIKVSFILFFTVHYFNTTHSSLVWIVRNV